MSRSTISVAAAVITFTGSSKRAVIRRRNRRGSRSPLARYGRSQKIGVANSIRGSFDRGYLSIKEARDKAAQVYGGLEPAIRRISAGDKPLGWSWSDLDREYQNSLKKSRWSAGRIKPPSKGTMDDIRLAFIKPPVAALGPKALIALTSLDVTRAVEQVHAESGHRAACKTLAYIKSALSWALSKRGEKSGLYGTMPWWAALLPPDPTDTEMGQMEQRKRALAMAKVAFSVDHLGALLVEHEDFCAGRQAAKKISPGVRWGLWWIAFTGNRRFTPLLARESARYSVSRSSISRALSCSAQMSTSIPQPVLMSITSLCFFAAGPH